MKCPGCEHETTMHNEENGCTDDVETKCGNCSENDSDACPCTLTPTGIDMVLAVGGHMREQQAA